VSTIGNILDRAVVVFGLTRWAKVGFSAVDFWIAEDIAWPCLSSHYSCFASSLVLAVSKHSPFESRADFRNRVRTVGDFLLQST
jgi:hypothetical protein